MPFPQLRANDAIASARSMLHARYTGELDTLAQSLERQGLAGPASEVRSWLPPRPPDVITLFVLPDEAPWSLPEPAAWLGEFRKLREARAEDVFALARGGRGPALVVGNGVGARSRARKSRT